MEDQSSKRDNREHDNRKSPRFSDFSCGEKLGEKLQTGAFSVLDGRVKYGDRL
jgi:hypothetical protein